MLKLCMFMREDCLGMRRASNGMCAQFIHSAECGCLNPATNSLGFIGDPPKNKDSTVAQEPFPSFPAQLLNLKFRCNSCRQ